MSDDIESQVKGMAALVLSSGRLSEFHEKNLKMYGCLYFDSKSMKIEYDLSVRHDVDVDNKNNLTVKKPLQHCYIAYHFEMEPERAAKNDNLHKRFEALEKSVRSLLWRDLPIEIYFNDQIVYKSKK